MREYSARVVVRSRPVQVGVEAKEVEQLLVGLILDGRVKGRIDQVEKVLELAPAADAGTDKYAALERWGKQVQALHAAAAARLAF